MTLDRIKMMVKEEIGLDESSVGSVLVNSKIASRMQVVGIEREGEYADFLANSRHEMQLLVEELVIPETWFFRDQAPFDAMVKFLNKDWARRSFGTKIQILSIPCSSGEEPYSIAMALLEAGVQRESFSIDAVDVSSKIIEKAKKGLYSMNSFRGKKDIMNRFFTPDGGLYAINDEVKSCVTFNSGNLVSDEFCFNSSSYDVIFCRNLLIYFDRKTQRNAFSRFYNLLSEDGIIFFGHADTGGAVSDFFDNASYPLAFAYKKRSKKRLESPLLAKKKTFSNTDMPALGAGLTRSTNIAPLGFATKKMNKSSPVTTISTSDSASGSSSLKEIQRLADKGEVAEAEILCKKYLAKFPSSDEAYCLMGVLCEAGSNFADAKDNFLKASYLNPDNYEALVHLSLQARRENDGVTAEKYMQRADRVKKRVDKTGTLGRGGWK